MSLTPARGGADIAPGSGELMAHVVSALPALPPLIRYYDEFDDVTRSIASPDKAEAFELQIYGRTHRLELSRYPAAYGLLVKQLFLYLLGEGLHAMSAFKAANGAMHFSMTEVEKLMGAGPHKVSREWTLMRARDLPQDAYRFGKTLLRLLCIHRLCGWSPTYGEFIRSSLPGPASDSHAGGIRAMSSYRSTRRQQSCGTWMKWLPSLGRRQPQLRRTKKSATQE